MEQTEVKKMNWTAAITALFVSALILMILPMILIGYEAWFKETPDFGRALRGGLIVDVTICTTYSLCAMFQDLYNDFIKD